ncbi:GGDEF domain-containing protein [Candidatus Saccharibacteria bacterium]|nr:GGDEF domain-containing protein [Candidatus Saccharibacteria bacterium]
MKKHRIRNLLLYIGINRDNFMEILPEINHANRVMVLAISGFATLLITVMLIASFFVEGVSMNRHVYMLGTAISLALFLTAWSPAKRYPVLVNLLVTLSFMIFDFYGILIGTITDPSQKTVTFIVMLVFIPTLFVARPIHSLGVTIFHVAIFIALCFRHKTGAVLQNDLMDAVVFGILGLASSTIINYQKVKGYVSARQLQKVSRTDALTEMQNRNAYELDLYTIPERCRDALACIFIDANGLKSINDQKGHKYGDRMLKAIADCIKQHFGEELSYRFGGDEFIVYIPDPDAESVRAKVEQLRSDVARRGHTVSIGYEMHYLDGLSMHNIYKSAETKMYREKKEFYKKTGLSR